MNQNIFWGLYMLAFAVPLYFVAYFVGWKPLHKEKRCSQKTTGIITRYSRVQYNGISLPVVEYDVGEDTYEVVGPKFKGGVNMYISAPFFNVVTEQTSNLEEGEPLPDVVVTRQKRNSRSSVTFSPLLELLPIGKEVDVYYNPQKPKEAYVIRHVVPYRFLSFWLPIIFAVLCTAGALILLIMQPIAG